MKPRKIAHSGQVVRVQDKAPSSRPWGHVRRTSKKSRICEGGRGCGTQTNMATRAEGAGGSALSLGSTAACG